MLDIVNGKLDYDMIGDCDFVGLTTDSIVTTVDNDDRTIKADLNFKDLPKNEDGKYIDGSYILQAEVSNGQVRLIWTSKGINSEPCYYGSVVVDNVNDITATTIMNACDVDNVKIDKNIGKQYSYKELARSRCLFAYPKVYGDLSKIIFTATSWDVISTFNKIELDIDGVAYNVYAQATYSTGSYTFAFKFV